MATRSNVIPIQKNQQRASRQASAQTITMHKGAPDIWIFLITILLVGIGVVMVFSASYYDTISKDPLLYFKRQGTFACVGLLVMLFAMRISHHKYRYLAKILLYGTFALLLLVFAFEDTSGASRWIPIPLGDLQVQPSEIIKFTLTLFMADQLSRRNANPNDLAGVLGKMLLIIGAAFFLVVKEPDLGNAIIIACIAMSILLAAGLSWLYAIGIAVAGCGAGYFLVKNSAYQMRRIEGFLDPWADPSGTGYQTINSFLALGSGGLWGVGMGGSRQKLGFLPEQYTDFIFSIIGEELGFLGASLIILLFLLFTWRGYLIALRCPDLYGSLLAVGITTGIGLQAALNIGVATGSLPVTGIVLPFLSYGGSSLLMSMGSVGVLLNISRYHA